MVRFLLAFSLVTLFYQALAKSNVQYKNCGTSDDILTLDDVSFEPEYVQPGNKITIDASGDLSQDITKGAKVQVNLDYFGQSYFSHTYDYCDFVDSRDDFDSDAKCPVSKGYLEVSQEITLPSTIPKGTYTLHITATTESDEPIACAEVVVNL